MRSSVGIEPFQAGPFAFSSAALNRLHPFGRMRPLRIPLPAPKRRPFLHSTRRPARGLPVHGEGFRLDLHEQAPDAADRTVEPRELGGFQVGEEARRPWFEVPLEEPPLGPRLSLELAG